MPEQHGRRGACFRVHGRLDVWNGSPSIRLWQIGTHHMLGVDPPESAIMPKVLLTQLEAGYSSTATTWSVRSNANGRSGRARSASRARRISSPLTARENFLPRESPALFPFATALIRRRMPPKKTRGVSRLRLDGRGGPSLSSDPWGSIPTSCGRPVWPAPLWSGRCGWRGAIYSAGVTRHICRCSGQRRRSITATRRRR